MRGSTRPAIPRRPSTLALVGQTERRLMRILLVSAYFPPDTGSASHLYLELGGALRDLGHEVTVLTSLPGYHAHGDLKRYRAKLWVRETVEGIRVLRVATPRLPRRMVVGRAVWQFGLSISILAAGLAAGKQDVALVYSPPLPLGLAAWGIRRLRGTPFVLNVQDLFPQSIIDLGLLRNRRAIKLFEGMERLLYSKADAITVHAESNADHVVSKGAASSRVSAVPNWVDTTAISADGSGRTFRDRHGLGDEFVVSFAGVLGHSQDLEVVLDAAALLREKADIRWVIVGDGVRKRGLEEMAAKRCLTNVHFAPMVPRDDYPEVLYASDVCLANLKADVKTSVVPSKILSIMAAARPVVATLDPAGDAPKLIQRARCGYALTPEDPEALAYTIFELYSDRAMCRRLGSNGRAYAEANLSVQRAAEQYAALFRDMLGETAVSARRA